MQKPQEVAMKFVILIGSPKGETSITLQYIKFIQKHHSHSRHEWVYHHISGKIRAIEGNRELFDTIMSDIDSSDAVIWATPVYTLFVPAQLMRFVELIRERDQGGCFRGKHTGIISTSIHFYDHTAHRYMQAVCEDLDMNYIGFFSAEMDDILNPDGRTRLLTFAEYFINSVSEKVTPQKWPAPVKDSAVLFEPEPVKEKVNPMGKKIIIVTDTTDPQSNTTRMIQRFSDSFLEKVDLFNLWDIEIKGGCTGCIRCGYDNACKYQDDFAEFYRLQVMTADIVIFAVTLTNLNMSSKFKEFFDRRFFMNHAPDLQGKQVGFLVSGPVRQMPYMYDFFQGAIEWQNANLAGIVSDGNGSCASINQNIQHLARTAVSFCDAGYCSPRTFLGVSGAKIFRDDIWGKLRYVFQADYRFYKKNQLFDFPHDKYKSRIFNLIIRLLTKIPLFRKEFYKKAKILHSKPHKKIVERY